MAKLDQFELNLKDFLECELDHEATKTLEDIIAEITEETNVIALAMFLNANDELSPTLVPYMFLKIHKLEAEIKKLKEN